jgi:putative cardiolipin synthase
MGSFKATVFASVLALAIATGFTAQADQIKFIARPEIALSAFTGLAGSAKKSIDLVYFIFEPCHASGQVLMDILTQKAKSGVRVRILLDSFLQNKAQQANLAADFAARGIELRWYNNTALLSPAGNMRSHVKLLLADDQTYITGGRNIADDYFAMAEGANFSDRDVLVTGDSAKQAAVSFTEMWTSSNVQPAQITTAYVPWKKFCQGNTTSTLGQVAKAKAYLKRNAKSQVAAVPTRTCNDVQFITDHPDFGSSIYGSQYNSGPEETPAFDDYMTSIRLKMKRVTNAFLKFVDGTKSKIVFENWSYLPAGYMYESFSQLRDRNVPVEVITNADMDGPGILKYSEEYANNVMAYRDQVGSEDVLQLSMHGSLNESYELTPKKAQFRLHGKLAVRDGRDVMVSSYNIDPRSYSTNLESMVLALNCPQLAGDIDNKLLELRRTYAADVKSGRIPQQKDGGWLAKMIAFVGYNFL